MAKNDILLRLRAKQRAELKGMQAFMLQLSGDIMLIAANEAFGFGRERAARLHEAWVQTWRDFGDLILDDLKSDKDLEYSKEKIDRRLQEFLGEYFAPWDERYGN